MSIRYRIRHETEYKYAMPVSFGHSQLFLRPRDLPHQRCLSSLIDIEPSPGSANIRTDYFGNHTMLYSVQESHQRMTISSINEVEVDPLLPPSPGESPAWEDIRELVRRADRPVTLQALEFTFNSILVRTHRELTEYATESFSAGRPIVDACLELTQRIFKDFKYDPSTTTISTPVAEVFAQRSGVCQDFAHLQIAMLRGLGLPVRYVSGYLRTFRDPKKTDPKLIGADASHAWLGVYIGDERWVDFDPTNNQIPQEHHVTIGWGRDYADVSPVKGVIVGGGEQKIAVRVHVDAI